MRHAGLRFGQLSSSPIPIPLNKGSKVTSNVINSRSAISRSPVTAVKRFATSNTAAITPATKMITAAAFLLCLIIFRFFTSATLALNYTKPFSITSMQLSIPKRLRSAWGRA